MEILSQNNPHEEFSPVRCPSLALQTYEYFSGDPDRESSKEAFAVGEKTHLGMSYPLLDGSVDSIRDELLDRRSVAVGLYGEESVTTTSIDFRLEQADFLETAAKLKEAHDAGDAAAAGVLAQEFVARTERIYGKPDEATDKSVLGTIRRSYDVDNPRVQQLWQELEGGFSTILANGEEVSVPGIEFPSEFDELPTLSQSAQKYLRQVWRQFDGILLDIQSNVADQIMVANGVIDPAHARREETVFSGNDLAKVFRVAATAVSSQYDTGHIDVIVNENGSSASWSSGKQAVVVGANRSEKLGEWRKIRGTVPHEMTHGLKSANGQKMKEPALATGVFTRDADGNWVSYLDFEEGNNKLGESLLMDTELAPYDIENDYGYVLIARLAYMGMDDRQIMEAMKKLYEIEDTVKHPGKKPSPKLIAQRATTRLERIFRGTPVDPALRVDGHMPIYTKDSSSYYYGHLKAVKYWNHVAEQAETTDDPLAYVQEQFDIQNRGKIDPTVPEQARLVL